VLASVPPACLTGPAPVFFSSAAHKNTLALASPGITWHHLWHDLNTYKLLIYKDFYLSRVGHASDASKNTHTHARAISRCSGWFFGNESHSQNAHITSPQLCLYSGKLA
jgi:hypothetical protein